MGSGFGNDDDLAIAPPAPDTLEHRVFEARLEARLLGGEPALPRVDRFVLERLLGAGGMGTVWLARDDRLGRRVALKLVRQGGVAGERMRLREARGLARITHPNVIGVYDVGEHDGKVWLAMEYVPGRTLRACAGELAQAEALVHWMAVGRGLAAIHEAGLVHRDVKPDNVLLGDDGRVRVIDLGLAREAAVRPAGARTGAPTKEVMLTAGFVGTRAYAAPEQLRGEPVDARADQYAYAVALLESLRAARPNVGADAAIEPALLAALERARHEDPARRFARMTELLEALAAAARRDGPPTPAASDSDAVTRESPLRVSPSLEADSTIASDPSSSTRAPEPPLVARIGHYELLGELGRGGMGVVYIAFDPRLDRKVAIKRLLGGRREHRRRLLREALAMAKLSHPNVIPIYEIVDGGDATHIVMEYVQGQTLRDWSATPRSRDEVLAVYKAAARGLAAAHQKRLVHRDFKPDNVIFGDDGRVRVMDFGLASVNARPDEDRDHEPAPAAPLDSLLTRPGMLMGTPAYMSPEQMRGEPATVASDVFSFCVALYEGLHGERPFAGRTFEELTAAVTQAAIRPAPADRSVPAWLRALVCRGLALDPADRFESMQALLDAIVAGELAEHAGGREPPAYVFVAHAGRDKPAVLRLCERLVDHGVRPWLDLWELAPGADVHAAAEQALRAAPAVIVCGGAERTAALAARVDRDPASLVGVRLPGGEAPGVGHAVVALEEGRWDEGVLELARRVGVDTRRARWLADEAARAGVAEGALSPYRGLEAFREQDARWMFGRDTEVEALLELVRAGQTRFLVLIGASGSGKSSLIMAGVAPMLRCDALGDGVAWSIATLRPGPRPCEALAHALVHLATGGDAHPDPAIVKRLRDELLAGDDTLRIRLGGRRRRRTLLVIDQLEELFTEAGLGGPGGPAGHAEALAFVRNLLEATQERAGLDSNLWIAATLRADFVQRGLEVPELARALQVGTYFALPPMSEPQIRAAVERPAARVGYRVEPRVVDRLVAAAAHQAGRLPLLQHVLRELWTHRDADRRLLGDAAYAETGGLEGAIAVAAERALDGLRRRLGPDGELVTRRLMTRLVNLGDRTSEDTRRRVTLASLGHDEATRQVLDAFVREARVLVAAEMDGVETVEIAHEALLREWTTLVRWLDADRGALKLRQELAQDAARGSEGEYLWGPGRVEEARRVLDASTVELDAVERGFLAASDRSVRRRRRLVQAGVAALLAAAAITVVVVNAQRADAVRGRQDADTAREGAETAQRQAEAAEAEARAAYAQAERDRTAAEQARTLAENSQKENERSLKQMFEVALRPLTERLIAQRQAIGVIAVDDRWTTLLARDKKTMVAASLGESFRALVAGHDAFLADADAGGRSTFLEITTQWLLADQARRELAILRPPAAAGRAHVALERNLLRLGHTLEVLPALTEAEALADVGMLILDGTTTPALAAADVAAIAAFVQRGGGILAVGRPPLAADQGAYPLNVALAARGARWTADEVGPKLLAERETPAIVRFENKLAVEVHLYTLTAGRDEFYATLAPGEVRGFLTAIRRTWIYRTRQGGPELARVVIDGEEQTERIGAPVDRSKDADRDRPRPKLTPTPAPAPDAPEPEPPAELPESLNGVDTRAEKLEAARSAQACGKAARTLLHEATVDVTVEGDGAVQGVAVMPPAKGTPVAACLATELEQLKFPRTREGGTVSWKLKLF